MKNNIRGLFNKISRFDTKLNKLNVGFIISTGRTGTNFFESFYNRNFTSLVCNHEPIPDLYRFGIEYHRNGMDRKAVIQNLKYYRASIISELFKRNINTYIESNPFLSFVAPLLNEAFNTPKVLHIVRHPDTYIYSAINKDPDNSGRLFMTTEDHRNRLNANDFELDEHFNKWDKMNQFERVCWNWRFTNNYVFDHLNGQKNYLLLKFEDIFFKKIEESLRKMIDFFDINELSRSDMQKLLDDFNIKVNNTAERKVDKYEEVKARNIDFYNLTLDAELLNKFGY
jgi:hypothetical protein